MTNIELSYNPDYYEGPKTNVFIYFSNPDFSYFVTDIAKIKPTVDGIDNLFDIGHWAGAFYYLAVGGECTPEQFGCTFEKGAFTFDGKESNLFTI